MAPRTLVWPAEVKGLAEERGYQLNKYGKHSKASWVLDIAGPFCFWPRRVDKGAYSRTDVLASRVSKLLKLSSTATYDHISQQSRIRVSITQAERDRLIRQEYRRAVGH